jgi:lysyl-tRNA synthetase class 2
MGKILFMNLADEDSQIQLFFRENELADQFDSAQMIDIGDIIGATGEIFKTKTGELSVWITSFAILNKSLTGLVDSYYGLKDIELKYRNRSMDMIVNKESRDILKKRFQITAKIREFMVNEGFLEVETPILQVVYGGAAAKPFETHHHKLDMKMYMRVAPEQHLKRVMIGGMEAVFEIGKCFRNENIDRTHNPEFTMIEMYRAYKDYNYMMDLMERLFEKLCLDLFGATTIKCQGEEISFNRPWKKLTVKDTLREIAGINVDEMSNEQIIELAGKTDKKMNQANRGEAMLVLFEEHCEPKLIQPTHIIDYPKESTAFCKTHREDPELIERFESFVGGREISNGYSELNDPVLQRKLLESQQKMADEGIEETWGMVDEEFLDAMDIGLPPAAGLGIGIDRLVMTLLDQSSIRDIIYFPTMKPEK